VRLCEPPIDQAAELDIVRRALSLRARGCIGVLWAESGRYWISRDEYHPYASRVGISVARLKELVETVEAILEMDGAVTETKPAIAETKSAMRKQPARESQDERERLCG